MGWFEETTEFIRQIHGSGKFIPLHEPRFLGNEKKYLADCIDSTFVSSVGPYVTEFEKKIAEYTGSRFAVATVNGTAALHLALIADGVSSEDEILTQPLTFIATANAIKYIGAHPVFLDVDRTTLGMSPESLNSFLETNAAVENGFCINKRSNRRIKACVPMHTFGFPCRIEEIASICRNYHIDLIEDAAESLGSTFKRKHTGTFGKIGILSFNGNKILTTGGGGMILTDDEQIAKNAKHLSTQAKVSHPWEFYHDMTGYNYRMPNINAALGLAQLEMIPQFLQKKRALAAVYKAHFEKLSIEFVIEPKDSISNYWLNTLIVKDINERDEFLKYSNDKGVMTRPAWTLMNKLPMYENCVTFNLKNAEWLSERIVNIPSSVIL